MGTGRGTCLVSELRGRPLVLSALALAVGIGARSSPLVALGLIVLLWLAGWSWRALMVGGFGLVGFLISPLSPMRSLNSAQPFEGRADVISVARPGRFGEQVVVMADGRRLIWQLRPGEIANWGDRFRVKGELRPFGDAGGGGLARMGLAGRLVTQRAFLEASGTNLARVGSGLRVSFGLAMSRDLSADDAAMVRALTFNDDAQVSDEVKDGLRATGVIHIISTSGMHVMLLSLLLMQVLQRLRMHRWGQLVLLGVLLVLYVMAAGWRPPAMRAMILALLVWLPYAFDREADALSALAVAFLGTIIWQPYEILNAGFQLSYVSVIALVMFGQLQWVAMEESTPRVILRRLGVLLRASLVATVATAPLLAYHFGEFSWLGPIVNLMVGFVVLPIVAGGLLLWMLPFFAWLGVPLMLAALCQYIGVVVSAMGRGATLVQVGPFSAWWLVLIYGAAILMWEPRRKLPTQTN